MERIAWAAKLLDLTPYLARKPRSSPAVSASALRWGARSSAIRRCSSWTSRCRTSTRSFASRCGLRSRKLQHEIGTTTIYVTHDQVEAMTLGDRVAVMSMGVLQQVDEPQRLYDEPANLFVASFIGTPPMNLFRGSVRVDNGHVFARVGVVELPVGESCVRRYAAVKAMDGRNVVVGMRSEDIHPANARPELPTLPATVELLEALGSGVMAYLHVDAEPVRTPSAHGSGPEEERRGRGDREAQPHRPFPAADRPEPG